MKPVFDLKRLRQLKALIGEVKYAAALESFKRELHACIEAIAEDTDKGEHAHKLAGVAGLLGFEDLEYQSRRFLTACHVGGEDLGPATESLLLAALRAENALTGSPA